MLSHEARIVEAILFIENEALTIEKLAAMSNLSEKDCEKALKELDKLYQNQGHGIFLKQAYSLILCPYITNKHMLFTYAYYNIFLYMLIAYELSFFKNYVYDVY